MDFDAVLEKCGNFGRYQLVLLLLFGYTNILSSMHYFAQTIITFTPPHWCYHDKLMNASISFIRELYSQTPNPGCTLLDGIVNGNKPIVAQYGECTKWIFEYESGYKSVTTDLKWVCHNSYKSAVGQSLFFTGSVIGTISFGILSDKIGRLPAIICTTLTGASGDFLTSFTNSLPTFALSRFISGLSTDTLFYLMYILTFEYLCQEKRTFGLNIITAFFYTIGLMLSPWYAIWVGSWRLYMLIASLPALLVIVYPFFICESAQWLINKNRYGEAVKCLKRVARTNGRHVDEDVFKQFKLYYEEKITEERKLNKNQDTFWGLFRTPRLRKFTTILLLKSMIITVSTDVVGRNMEGMGTSPFLLFSISSVAYFFGGFIIISLQNRIGRKGMACGSMFASAIVTAVTGVLIAFLDRDRYAVMLAVMVCLGRLGAVMGFESEAQYAAEFMPTTVRGRGMANIHVVGYGCAMLSPYILHLGNFYKPLPAVVISAIMLSGAVLCLALPETLNQKLPETLKDGEEFARHQRWYYFPCFKKQESIRESDT